MPKWLPAVVLIVAALIVEAVLWWLAFTHLDKPSFSAAIVGAASGLLVAAVGITSSLLVSAASLRNSLALFKKQDEANLAAFGRQQQAALDMFKLQREADRKIRFIEQKRAACERVLTAANVYFEAAAAQEVAFAALESADQSERDIRNAEFNALALEQERLLADLDGARWTLLLLAEELADPLASLYDAVIDQSGNRQQTLARQKAATTQFIDIARKELQVGPVDSGVLPTSS